MTPLIDKLRQRQQAEKMTDEDFARHLGMSPAMWSMLQSGERRIGVRSIRAILRRYPTLADDCLQAVATPPFASPYD